MIVLILVFDMLKSASSNSKVSLLKKSVASAKKMD